MARVRALPKDPSLEHLRKQAKDLLDALLQGDPRAVGRFSLCFEVTGSDPTEFKLTQAQLVLAREQGFPSWSQLTAWVTDRRLPTSPEDLVRALASRTYRVRAAVEKALTATGQAGITAAIAGLSDANPRVRYGSAAFMDHHADDACVPKLMELALHDPVPYVRGIALHALACQRCKPQPLTVDVVPLLINLARTDERWRVRRGAAWSLAQRLADPGVREALQSMLEHDSDPRVSEAAKNGLRRPSPGPAHLKEARLRALAARRAPAGQPATLAV